MESDIKCGPYDGKYSYEPFSLYCAYTHVTLATIGEIIERYTKGNHLLRCDPDYSGDGVEVESNRIIVAILPRDFTEIARSFGAKDSQRPFWIVPYRLSPSHGPDPEKHDTKIVLHIPLDVPYSVVYKNICDIVTMFCGRPTGFSVEIPVDPNKGKLLDRHTGHGFILLRDSKTMSIEDFIRLRVLLNNFTFSYGEGKIYKINSAWYFRKDNPERRRKAEAASSDEGRKPFRGKGNRGGRSYAAVAKKPEMENPFDPLAAPPEISLLKEGDV